MLHALATLVDTQEDAIEQTHDAVVQLARAAAALAIPCAGRAGQIVARPARGLKGNTSVIKR